MQDTAASLRGVLEFLGLAVEDEAVVRATAASSFAAMADSERRHPIAGHTYDPTDPSARRVIGGHRDDLTPEEVATVAAALRAHLNDAALDVLIAHGVAGSLV